MRILLIEDDEILADRLGECLKAQRYIVDAITDGQIGWEYALSTPYDLIVTDVGLPKIDGITLCERLRRQGYTTPILLMTAKDAPEERIRGLDAGADDHLTKPLNLDEFLARVRALLRRGEVLAETVLEVGALRLDPVSCQVAYNEQPLKLTPKEYSLLELFLRNPTRVFSRSHIIEHLWSYEDPPLEDSVKAHIKGLRRKLKQVRAADWIENVYGIGYRFNPAMVVESSQTNPSLQDLAAKQPEPFGRDLRAEMLDASTIPSSSMEPIPPVSTLEETYSQSMQGLWQKYQTLMAQRLELLQQAATAVQRDALTAALQADATQAAHKLAGVLGMFERDNGSEIAREIEICLENRRLEAIPSLVQQLDAILALEPISTLPPPLPTEVALLVSDNQPLFTALQALNSNATLTWAHVAALDQAMSAVEQFAPTVVVVDIAAASQWMPSLEFLQRLASQKPGVLILALTTTDSLVDRVAISRVGIQRLLVQPISASQLWTAVQQVHRRRKPMMARVLVVDDDPIVAATLHTLLDPWGMVVTGLDDPQQFWQTLTAAQPDLLILDVEMPRFSGIDLCQAVRTDPHWQNLPVLFLTTHRDPETVQHVFRAGGDDYICKPIVGPELLTRIINRLERTRLLQTLSERDSATGLPGQAISQQALQKGFEHARAQDGVFSLALICLNDLRTVNVESGHDAGRRLLQAWGQCFQTQLRGSEQVGYWGRGEFLVGMPDLSYSEATEYLEPLLQTLRRQIVTLPSGDRIQPAFEVAVIEAPEQGQTLQGLYQEAIAQLGK